MCAQIASARFRLRPQPVAAAKVAHLLPKGPARGWPARASEPARDERGERSPTSLAGALMANWRSGAKPRRPRLAGAARRHKTRKFSFARRHLLLVLWPIREALGRARHSSGNTPRVRLLTRRRSGCASKVIHIAARISLSRAARAAEPAQKAQLLRAPVGGATARLINSHATPEPACSASPPPVSAGLALSTRRRANHASRSRRA